MNWLTSLLLALVPRNAEQVVAERDLLLKAASVIGDLIAIVRTVPPKQGRQGLMATSASDEDLINVSQVVEGELRKLATKGGK